MSFLPALFPTPSKCPVAQASLLPVFHIPPQSLVCCLGKNKKGCFLQALVGQCSWVIVEGEGYDDDDDDDEDKHKQSSPLQTLGNVPISSYLFLFGLGDKYSTFIYPVT